jgi:hypothetical protein
LGAIGNHRRFPIIILIRLSTSFNLNYLQQSNDV